MPIDSLAESASGAGPPPALPPPAALKCASCGAASLGPTDGVVILGEQIERVCAACVRNGDVAPSAAVPQSLPPSPTTLGLGLTGLSVSSPRDSAVVIDLANVARLRSPTRCRRSSSSTADSVHSATDTPNGGGEGASGSPLASTSLPAVPGAAPVPTSTPSASSSSAAPSQAIPVPAREDEDSPAQLHAKSLPAARASPWATVSKPPAPAPTPASPLPTDTAPNPLLEVGRARVRSESRGCLYPGSVFKGTQRSGRSAYDVEIKLVDVNFASWTVCGYLTIANLTDTHPELTTFFDGEIIGPKYGFITGQRFGATEVDDRRHWERFEQFLRPATKADIVRPEMLLREPLPNINRGETQPRERDFVFLRIKEKFLVPDHTVRDISGASFAGFYYAMVDMSPALQMDEPGSPLSTSRLSARRQSSTTVVRPDAAPRRMSSSTSGRRASTSTGTISTRPEGQRRQSSSRAAPEPREPTLRGYYFHSLNNEFQELFLRHVPSTSAGTFELR